MDQTFYTTMPAMQSIRQLTDADFYHPVPADWVIVMTDVRGSTKAVRDGRYKDVCAVAAASIAAQLNVMGQSDTPFIFGGDGATILMPPEVRPAATAALVGTRVMARQQFELDLRIAVIPVADVVQAGHTIRVAKLEMSENFQQAIFSGGGIRYAEDLLKAEDANPRYTVPEDATEPDADFHGVECRWNEIPSRGDETVSLLVMATGQTPADDDLIYRRVIDQIDMIYGSSVERHPIRVQDLRMAFSPKALSVEGRIRHQQAYGWRRFRKMLWNSFKAWIAMRFGIGQWGQYKQYLVEATDHEKFDDVLRMVLGGNVSQREQLRAYLEDERQAGQLYYGISTSPATLVTCIVYDYFGRQMHLVDGSGGGYTNAAREMKAQMHPG